MDAGIASLASREEGIKLAIDLGLSAAQQQTQAAATMQAATDRSGEWVQRLTAGETTVRLEIPG